MWLCMQGPGFYPQEKKILNVDGEIFCKVGESHEHVMGCTMFSEGQGPCRRGQFMSR